MLYFGIGKYISLNSRKGFWGKGAVDAISEKLQRQLPGLRGYSSRNLRNMRQFYEEWSILESERDTYDNLAVTSAKIDDPDELKAINPIWQLQLPKQLGSDIDGDGFPLEAFLSIGFTQHVHIITKIKDYNERLFYIKRCASEHYTVDLLFFNRRLNCLVAVELKTGKFKTSYLGELQGYLSVLDGFEKMPHENPSIGLILCKDMSEELKNALPDIEELKKLLDSEEMPDDGEE